MRRISKLNSDCDIPCEMVKSGTAADVLVVCL